MLLNHKTNKTDYYIVFNYLICYDPVLCVAYVHHPLLLFLHTGLSDVHIRFLMLNPEGIFCKSLTLASVIRCHGCCRIIRVPAVIIQELFTLRLTLGSRRLETRLFILVRFHTLSRVTTGIYPGVMKHFCILKQNQDTFYSVNSTLQCQMCTVWNNGVLERYDLLLSNRHPIIRVYSGTST